jgi:hypothetical protein
MAIALGGRPDDKAKMVCSRGCIAYLFKSPWKGNAISTRQWRPAAWRSRAFLLQQLSSFYAATVRKGALARYPIDTENVYVSTI